jgi:ATP-dependent DNA helicase RecG
MPAAGYTLRSSVSCLKGVGPKVAEHLARIKIHTIADLLFHLPLRYEDRTRVYAINELQPLARVLIRGHVANIRVVGRKRRLMCTVSDATGSLELCFFHFNRAQIQRLHTPGIVLQCFGEVRQGPQRRLQMVHPEYNVYSDSVETTLAKTLTPIYPTTEGLQQTMMRKLVAAALLLLRSGHLLPELIPEKIRSEFNFSSLTEALLFVHSPPEQVDQTLLTSGAHPAQQRLIVEELLAHQIGLLQVRKRIQVGEALAITDGYDLVSRFLAALPFELTAAQQRVVKEIQCDMSASVAMLRLVQGDVGSGKTVVAAYAIVLVVSQGAQAALMAPTEILAEQHLQTMTAWLQPLGVRIGFLSGSMTPAERVRVVNKIVAKEYDLVIGTHALFQTKVSFHSLALMVVDEQHRFGVHQRLALKDKGKAAGLTPHQLVMTATPIPRSMAMTVYGDLDCSIIDELPPGRKPVTTLLVEQQRRTEIVQRLFDHCQQGTQAYWICTLVEESETLRAKAAELVFTELQAAMPQVAVALVHGRLKAAEKAQVMQDFKNSKAQLLVATTVVEVGVDVSNASLMVIDNPERLGLAQLHQLRGRIGRGSKASYCVLLYQSPLSKTAFKRLSLMRSTADGFVIAEQDLRMRGPGELLGTRQAGLLSFRVADIVRDEVWLDKVSVWAKSLSEFHPDNAAALVHRWMQDKPILATV